MSQRGAWLSAGLLMASQVLVAGLGSAAPLGAPSVAVSGSQGGAGERKIAKSHQVGRAPAAPRPTLPEGIAPGSDDMESRRAVAGGVPKDERSVPLADPELDALRDAERVLFPRPLQGVTRGWRWEFQERDAISSGPAVHRFGKSVAPGVDAPTSQWLETLAMPNLPVKLDGRVVKYLKFYRDAKLGKNIAQNWVKKSGRYVAAMKAEFARAGLPTDLVWLSLIESGHNPTIRSPAGAAGIWQFIPATARMYGLTVDRWVDERLDPEASTRAAARFLRDLQQRFGSWELAMGAYNMGHAGMLRSVRKFNTNDYWALGRMEGALPWETSLYVPKIFALAIVMNNKKAFGLADIPLDPAVSFDEVRVEPLVNLADVAEASESSVALLSELNPQYLAGTTPPRTAEQTARRWTVHVPVGQGKETAAALLGKRGDSSYRPYAVRFGDSVELVADAHAVAPAELRRINRLRATEEVSVGTILLVPKQAAAKPDHEEMVVVRGGNFHYPSKNRVFYRALEGDTLNDVARAFAVDVADVIAWNGMDGSAHLQSEMMLQVFVPKNADLTGVRHVLAKDTRFVEAGSERFVEYFEEKSGRKRVVVGALMGDTLTTIGKRYGLTAGMMERINRYSRTKKLRKGDPVIVYTKHPAKEVTAGPTPLAAPKPPRPELLPQRKQASALPAPQR